MPPSTATRALLVLLLSARTVWAQLVPLEGFQVNTYTPNGQLVPAVASDAAGNFVVVWEGYRSGSYEIRARRYDAGGVPLGGEFQVNSYTTGTQRFGAVARNAAGAFVVVWDSRGGTGSDTDSYGVHARRYDAGGAPLGDQIQVNTYTTGDQVAPAVAVDGGGNFVVVWASGRTGTTFVETIKGQRFDANGAPAGGEFQVNTDTTYGRSAPAVSTDPAGNFVVVWQTTGMYASIIEGRRYDAAGIPAGVEFLVSDANTSGQQRAAVASDPSGNFVVAWTAEAGSYASSIQAKRYDGNGMLIGAQFQVNTYTTNYQYAPSVAADGAGNFVVVWETFYRGDFRFGDRSMRGRRYDALGAPTGGEFLVNGYTTGTHAFPAAAADGLGNVIVTWQDIGAPGDSDTSGLSVRAQRFALGYPIRGHKLVVKDAKASEAKRTVIALGTERATDIGPSIVGDPTVSGATLRLITTGATPSDETYLLGSSGWNALGSEGYEYAGPTDADGDPVKKVVLKRRPGGTAVLKAILKGSIGAQSLDVVPPNAGDEGSMILAIPGGGTYCVLFGGLAGGDEVADTGQLWKVTNADGQGCPEP